MDNEKQLKYYNAFIYSKGVYYIEQGYNSFKEAQDATKETPMKIIKLTTLENKNYKVKKGYEYAVAFDSKDFKPIEEDQYIHEYSVCSFDQGVYHILKGFASYHSAKAFLTKNSECGANLTIKASSIEKIIMDKKTIMFHKDYIVALPEAFDINDFE